MSRETEPKAGQPCQSCYLLAPFSPATPPRHPPAAKPEVYSILFHHLWAAVGGWRPLEQSTLFISANFCCAASCLCFSFAVFQFVFLGCSLPPAPFPPLHTPCSFLPFVLWFSAQPEISLEPTRRPSVMAAIDYRRARFEIITVHHLHQMHLQMQMQLQMQFQFTQQTTISTAAVGHVLCK